jgi:hypothetical protein
MAIASLAAALDLNASSSPARPLMRMRSMAEPDTSFPALGAHASHVASVKTIKAARFAPYLRTGLKGEAQIGKAGTLCEPVIEPGFAEALLIDTDRAKPSPLRVAPKLGYFDCTFDDFFRWSRKRQSLLWTSHKATLWLRFSGNRFEPTWDGHHTMTVEKSQRLDKGPKIR